jgi:hypothetical protein
MGPLFGQMPLTRLPLLDFRRVGRGSPFACTGAGNQDRVMVVFEELIAVNLASFLSAAAALSGSNQ